MGGQRRHPAVSDPAVPLLRLLPAGPLVQMCSLKKLIWKLSVTRIAMPLGIRAANRKRVCMAQPRGSTPLRHRWTSLGSTPPDAADLQTLSSCCHATREEMRPCFWTPFLACSSKTGPVIMRVL